MIKEGKKVLKEYKTHLESGNYKPRGIEGKLEAARAFLNYSEETGMDYAGISIKDSEGYREYLSVLTGKDGSPRYHPATINVTLANLKNFYSFLVSKGFADKNPFASTWRLKEPVSILKNILSVKEMGKLLCGVDEKEELFFKVVLELLYSTGCRISEIENLTREEINLKQGFIIIKDSKERQDRSAPLTEYANSILAYFLKKGSKDKPFLKGQQRTLNRWINERLKKKTEELGLPLVTCHGIRHTIATQLLHAGAGLREVQAFLGHKKIKNTEVYTRILTEDLKKVIEANHPREIKEK